MNRIIKSDLLRVMIESLPDAIVVADGKECIIAVNKEAEKLFGYEESELTGKPVSVYMPERFKSKYLNERKEIFENSKKGRISGNRKVRGRRKDGYEFDADVSISLIEAGENKFYSITSIRDISEITEEQNKLSEKNLNLELINKELEKYNYTISHDLKSPLHKIDSLTKILIDELKEGKSAEELENVSSYIQESIASAEKMISDVLKEAKDGTTDESDTIDLKNLFSELKKILSIPGNFIFEISCGFSFIPGKKINLLQVFLNLLSNSIKYNDKAEGHICISCKELSKHYEFSFKDNGRGIPDEKLAQIFELFEGTTSETPDKSHGIGLYTVKSIIEKRGGHIKVQSKVGTGTKFTFTWPKVKKAN